VLPHAPTFPNEPHVEVQKPRGVGEGCDRMTLYWYSMLVDLLVEGFTEGNGVAGVCFVRRSRGAIGGKPKVEAVEKMKTRPICVGESRPPARKPLHRAQATFVVNWGFIVGRRAC